MPRNDIEQFIKKYLKTSFGLVNIFCEIELSPSNSLFWGQMMNILSPLQWKLHKLSFVAIILYKMTPFQVRLKCVELFMVDIKWNGKNGKARTYTCTWDPTFFGDVHVITWTSLWLPITTVGISARDQLPGVWYPSLPFYLTHTTFKKTTTFIAIFSKFKLKHLIFVSF